MLPATEQMTYGGRSNRRQTVLPANFARELRSSNGNPRRPEAPGSLREPIMEQP